MAATVFAPTPAASAKPQQQAATIGKVGEIIETPYYQITLNSVSYPTTIPAPQNQQVILLSVTITAKVSDLPYNALYAKVKLSDNSEGGLWLAGFNPLLQAGTLQNGESVRGNIPYTFGGSASPSTFIYEPLVAGGGNARTTFALR